MNTLPNNIPYRIRLRKIMTWSPGERKVRLFRLLYSNGTNCMKPGWFSASLSISLVSEWWRRERTEHTWAVTVLGVRIHHKKSFGGWCC
jgi:hypothetical protein